MAVQILPGVDEYIHRGIEDLGETLSLLFETDRKTQKGIRNMFLQKPELIQEFVDLEKRAPGTLKRLGFGNIAGSLQGMDESTKQIIERATKGEAVKTGIAQAKGTAAKTELDLESLQGAIQLIQSDPQIRADYERGILDLPTVAQQAKAKRTEEVEVAGHPAEVKGAEARVQDIDPKIVELVEKITNKTPLSNEDALFLTTISRDEQKFKVFQEMMKLEGDKLSVGGNRILLMDKLEGAAREIFQNSPYSSVQDIANQVAAQFPEIDRNLIYEATNNATSAKTEAQGRIRAVAPLAFEGVATIRRLNEKARAEGREGPALGVLERLAQLDAKGGAITAGTFATMMSRGATGAAGIPRILAALGIGAASAPAIRGLARTLQDEEAQEFWLAAMNITAAQYRRESGSAVRLDEIRNTLERMISLSTDKAGPRAMKDRALEAFRSGLEFDSGLPDHTKFAEPAKGPEQQITNTDPREIPREAANVDDAAVSAAREYLNKFSGQTNPAIRASNQIQTDSSKIFGTGRVPNRSYFQAIELLKEVQAIDNQIGTLERTKSPYANDILAKLRNDRARILGGPMLPAAKRRSLGQYMNALNNEIIRLNNELPNLEGEKREKALQQLGTMRSLLVEADSVLKANE